VVPERPADSSAITRRGLRYLSALLLFGIGAVHLQQYFGVYYRVIPVIGPLFAANFAIAVLLGLALLIPLERIPRIGRPLLILTSAGAIAFAVGVIAGLELSEFGTLFGFHENGYRFAITLSLALEAAVVLLLSAFLALEAKATSRR